MYPAQTSLIPVQVALVRFIEQGGSILANYPYWYLGTTPFRYLTGPILPSVLAVLHRLLPNFSLFEIMFGVIGISWVVGGIGVFLLTQALIDADSDADKRGIATLAALFYLFGPIVPFLFRFSDGLYLMSFSFLPLTLLMYLRLLRRWERKTAILCIILIIFIILLDSLIIPTLVLGMAAIFLAQVGWKKTEEKVKQTLLVLSCSFLVATLWYTPGYWLTLLGAPSLGGVGVVRVIGWLGKLLPSALAIGIAIFSVKFFKKKNLLRDFCFYWLFIFGFLTLLRFLSDPDFWLDWSAYGTELQMGIGIGLGMILNSLLATLKHRTALPATEAQKFSVFQRFFSVSVILLFLFGIWLLVFNKYVLETLQPDISKTVEYRIGKQLSEIAKPQERVFLSGSTAFWLNAFSASWRIPQVRGGVDQGSVDPNWRRAVWEIREGSDPDKSIKWLKELDVSYLVVHTEESKEYYHDFYYPEKFERVPGLKKIYEEEGDRIYQVLTSPQK